MERYLFLTMQSFNTRDSRDIFRTFSDIKDVVISIIDKGFRPLTIFAKKLYLSCLTVL